MLMINNIKVAIIAFAGGVSFGAVTVYVLIQNGLLVGAFLIAPYPFLNDTWDLIAFLFPHGVIELLAICISGGAGLMLGWSLIAPGNLSRIDSLRKASLDALPLFGGVVIMLIVAAIIESFVARTGVPRELKLSVAALTAIGMVFYFGCAGRDQGCQVK